MYKQKGTGQARHGARSRSAVSSAAARRWVRSAAAMSSTCRKKVRALGLQARAVGQGQGRLASSCSTKPRPKDVKTKRAGQARFGKLGLGLGADRRRRQFDKNFQLSARNLADVDAAAGQPASTSTTSCSRDTLVLTKAARRSDRGALRHEHQLTT